MSTRVTSLALSRGVLQDVGRASQRLAATQQKLASGKELTKPSDDPSAVGRALGLHAEVEGAQQHTRNVDEALGWSEVTDAALGSITDALQRARELVVAGGSDGAGPVAPPAAATELKGLLDTMKSSANATYGGRYVFAGTKTDVAPYAPGGSDAYAGNGGVVGRAIGNGVTVPVNVVGTRVLGDGSGGLLATVRGTIAHLEGGTPADGDALRNGDLKALDSALDGLSAARAEVGSTTNRLETAKGRLSDLEATARQLLSTTEDTDVAKAMVDFSVQQAALQSALKAGATIVQSSLLDFLR